MFYDLLGLEPIQELDTDGGFEISFEFSKRWDTAVQVGPENLLLYCTPIVNLFSHEADPIRIEHERLAYRLRPHGADPKHYEIFSVDRVHGWDEGTSRQRVYEPFFSFKHGQETLGREDIFYRTRLQEAVVGRGTDSYISFVNNQDMTEMPATEVVSAELTCSNRSLPSQLRPGDIRVPTDNSPEYATFRNITTVTPSVPPPLGGELHWRLISHLSLNYQSLSRIDALRKVLSIYNFQALHDRQAARASELRLQGILSVKTHPAERLFRGTMVRGTQMQLELQEDRFAGEGDMVLFATILNEFFSLYATLNSFSHLEVRGTQQGETYQWPPKLGQQSII
jgi:type VI secretion system protein ImpG